jgi:hypothetical protein
MGKSETTKAIIKASGDAWDEFEKGLIELWDFNFVSSWIWAEEDTRFILHALYPSFHATIYHSYPTCKNRVILRPKSIKKIKWGPEYVFLFYWS